MPPSGRERLSRVLSLAVLCGAAAAAILPHLATLLSLRTFAEPLAVLALAAAATARLSRGRGEGAPIRLATAFVVTAIVFLPPPGGTIVALVAASLSRGAGLPATTSRGVTSAAASVAACALAEGLRVAYARNDPAVGLRGFLEVAAVFVVVQVTAVAIGRTLDAVGSRSPRTAPGAVPRRVLSEALNIPLAWLLLAQLELRAVHLFAALAAVYVLGGYGLRALEGAFRDVQAANRALAARVTELATLHAIGREVLSSLDPERVSRIVERECRKIFDVDFYFLALADRDTNEMRVLHRSGRDDERRETVLPPGEGLASWVMTSKRGIVVDDFQDRGVSLPFRPHAVEPDLRSAIAVPLVVEERAVGVLSLQSRRPHAYDDHALSLLTTVAQQAAVALENARHYAMATVDSLTGLFLRDYFFRRLEEEYSRAVRYGGSCVVLMIDLDGFKAINDRYGHLAGDRYLRAFGQTVRTRLRGADLACRYGGDEFCLLLPETDLEGARPIAERLRRTISGLSVDVGGAAARSTVSIGLAGFPQHDSGDLKALLLRADQALYQAKREGRDRVVSFAS